MKIDEKCSIQWPWQLSATSASIAIICYCFHPFVIVIVIVFVISIDKEEEENDGMMETMAIKQLSPTCTDYCFYLLLWLFLLLYCYCYANCCEQHLLITDFIFCCDNFCYCFGDCYHQHVLLFPLFVSFPLLQRNNTRGPKEQFYVRFFLSWERKTIVGGNSWQLLPYISNKGSPSRPTTFGAA